MADTFTANAKINNLKRTP